jgi:hypothetical protein
LPALAAAGLAVNSNSAHYRVKSAASIIFFNLAATRCSHKCVLFFTKHLKDSVSEDLEEKEKANYFRNSLFCFREW